MFKFWFILSFFSLFSHSSPDIPSALADISQKLAIEPFSLVAILIGISLLPILAISTTSFAKIVVVLSITRQAIGTPSSPPNIVIITMAIILSIFSMLPVIEGIQHNLAENDVLRKDNKNMLWDFLQSAKDPITGFMNKHTYQKDKDLFVELINRTGPTKASAQDLIVLAPAFLISELSLAFQIGFLIFLPFVVIDMIVANLLMALGMQMLSPTTISLPFKLMLFVLVDGWRLLVEGLITG